jgi:hypothetical protein
VNGGRLRAAGAGRVPTPSALVRVLAISRQVLLLLPGCIALWGCTSTVQLRDLAIENVSGTDSDEWLSGTSRSLLRVDLTTQADLTWDVEQWEMLIFANVASCSRPADDMEIGLRLHTSTPRPGGPPRSLNSGPSWGPRSCPKPAPAQRTYYLLLDIADRPTPNSTPPTVGFDLLKNPEDICISLRGEDPHILGPPSHRLRSNTVRLSSVAIREALRNYDGPIHLLE